MSRNIEKKVTLTELEFEELSESQRSLVEKAREMASQAYAPFSKFTVGAVLELENGQLVGGNNQENAAYPSGLCAERVAIFAAGANFPDSAPKQIMIYAKGENGELDEPAMPCGACLQAMWQYESRFKADIDIWLIGKKHVYKSEGVKMLLPFAFTSL